jgi:hypothetical protein
MFYQVSISFAVALLMAVSFADATGIPNTYNPQRIIREADAFDMFGPLSQISGTATASNASTPVDDNIFVQIPPGIDGSVLGAPDGALDEGPLISKIRPTKANFEGIGNADFGGSGVPPDPVGDVGPNHYVEMVNTAAAFYDKAGTLLLGPLTLAQIWEGFPIKDCAKNNGDPIVLHDQLVDRWILTQFTTGCISSDDPCYNCLAISTSPIPTGTYYRYAFRTQPDETTGFVFPDYPKYGVWSDSYVMTTVDFGDNSVGVSVYALEKDLMIAGDPTARAIQFVVDDGASINVPRRFYGNGLLPPDVDGTHFPPYGSPIPIIGSMDDDYIFGAPYDALNVWELSVDWNNPAVSYLAFTGDLETASFDSDFPCGDSGTRACIPQPGTVQKIDVLSYRQRLLYRLAYRHFGDYESMVSTQSVEARPGIAGTRWYEIRRYPDGVYKIHQQGTFSPNDGVNRWMGSIAQDAVGNMAIGYSVSSGTVFPGIRYAGRLADDDLGTMSLGEGTIIDGKGSQTSLKARWGDYTSMNIDPSDDCTFWYVNQYYEETSTFNWQTRVASFTLPHCLDDDDNVGKRSSSGKKSADQSTMFEYRKS